MQHEPGSLIFPGMTQRMPLSAMSLTAVLRRMGLWRSYRAWISLDLPRLGRRSHGFPDYVLEQALAHAICSAVEAADRRGDLFAKRVELMAAWAAYCTGEGEAGIERRCRAMARRTCRYSGTVREQIAAAFRRRLQFRETIARDWTWPLRCWPALQ